MLFSRTLMMCCLGWCFFSLSLSEAMSLLLTSERVFADLRDWLEFGEPEYAFS